MTGDKQTESGDAISFEDLDVFKRSYKASLAIYRASLEFPKIEQVHGIADQLRRASKSIPANVAEGWAKAHRSPAELRRFVTIAIGSADEMRVWLRYGLDLNYINEAQWQEWRDEYQAIAKMLHALAKSAVA